MKKYLFFTFFLALFNVSGVFAMVNPVKYAMEKQKELVLRNKEITASDAWKKLAKQTKITFFVWLSVPKGGPVVICDKKSGKQVKTAFDGWWKAVENYVFCMRRK